MIGAVVKSPEAAPPAKPPNGVPRLSSSARIWGLAGKLAMGARLKSFDDASFYNLCILLSREIDYATATNRVPDRVSELPAIFKLVCQRKNVCSLQAAIMTLMVTVKNACKAQWFSSNDSQELLSLANEVVSIFCTPEGFSCEQASIISNVSQIMSRYCPWLKLGHILAFVAIKPGFEACAVDFHISKNLTCSALERIRLLVAIKDNIDTSCCIINPPKVNLLLNGVGLRGRTVGCMYPGPQLPTIVNPMLRYGTNLLQAIGHFDAHYIALVAFMSVIPISDLPTPHDYVQPPAAAVDSDGEVIEGPSKISLNCPISFTRITKPAKGYLCKHLQCFDLSNYILINSKRPSWRCPHCNQPVCYPDIRIDTKMLKILQEVGEGVTNVTIHSDGSWEANSGSDEHHDELHAKAFEGLQSNQPEAPGPSNLCDLTEVDEVMITLDVDAPEDRKAVVQPDLQSIPICMNPSVPLVAGDPSQVNQNSATPSAVLTDSVPPAANREQQASLGTNQQSRSLNSVQPPSTYNFWLQQLQHAQMMSSDRGGYAIPRNVSRMPVTMQALPPVQMPSSRPLLSSGLPLMDNLPQNHTSLPLPTVSSGAGTLQRDSIQQQYISQSQLATAQMRGLRAPAQVFGNAFRATPGLQAPRQSPLTNHTPPQLVYMPPHLRATTQVPPGGSVSNINQTNTAGQRYPHMANAAQPMIPSQMQASRPLSELGPSPGSGGTAVRVSRMEDLLDVQSDQNWRPTRRMRGSLSGQAYSGAHDHLIIRPTQNMPAPTGQPSSQTNESPKLQPLLANKN